MNFVSDNYLLIGIVTMFFLFMLIFINILGIDLNSSHSSKLIQEITIETLDNMSNVDIADEFVKLNMDMNSSFCKTHKGKSDDLEKSCERLTEETCNNIDCCVWSNNKKCSAANVNKEQIYGK